MRLITTFAMALAMVCLTSWGTSAQAQLYRGLNAGQSFPFPGASSRVRASLGSRPAFRAERGRLALFPGLYYYQLQNVTGLPRHEEPPYFAKHPPVYYSHIVARPYGVSPYAASPGVVPVEMNVPVKPLQVTNPYIDEQIEVVVPGKTPSTPDAPVPATENQPPATPDRSAGERVEEEEETTKTTWIPNPFMETLVDGR